MSVSVVSFDAWYDALRLVAVDRLGVREGEWPCDGNPNMCSRCAKADALLAKEPQ